MNIKQLIGTTCIALVGVASAFDAALTDPLAWLYADSKIAAAERLDEIDVPANGVVDVNILVNGLKPGERLEFEASEKDGEWYRMRAVPVARNTGVNGCLEMTPGKNPYVARRAPFEVFDVLEPLAEPKITSAKETEGLYFRIQNPPKGAKSFDIRFRIKQGNEERQLSLKVNVHNVSLPPVGKDSFKYTNWMDFDSMAVSHGLELWSEEHWTMIEKYVRLAARGRQNVGMMRPVFDTDANGEVYLDKEKFSRFLDIYNRAGFWYLEGTHLARFTKGRGSPALKPRFSTNITTTVEGALTLSKLARMFMEEIEARGLKDRWFQHVADEPGGKSISEYRITAGIVRRYMPGIRTLDAVESPSFAGALDVWCPKVNSFERHHALYDSFRTNFGDRVWCYTCCFPGGKWMNRTMDGELLRPALIPWVSVMWDVDGFLHWGYNRWRRNQGQDPFKDPYPKRWGGSNNGNSLPPGDTHIVYPGKDGPWPSARLEATRAGMEDADLLTMLRRRDKAKADALVRRIARGFHDYTPSCKLYREVRRDIIRALEENETTRGWRVAELNGAPGLYHDGRPVPAMMFWQWEPQEKDSRDMSAAGMDIFAMFGSFPHYKNPYWRKGGSFGMKYQDEHIDNLLSWAPKVSVLPRIFYTAPDWWSVANPGERHVFVTPRKGAPARESFASLKCRKELSPYYRKAVRHLIDRYGDHLMGIHVANGPCGEHFSWDVMLGGASNLGSLWGDLSEPMRQAFIRYLRRKYGNDVARLREAFKDPKADFETVTLPGKDERGKSDGGWRDPAKGRRVLDYLECCNQVTVEMIDHYCGIVKDESKGTLPTLAFYGYVADDEWVCENDHRGISKIYRSKNLDMLSAPHTYRRRRLGEDGMQRQYLASAALHGKFFIDEGDDMTHLEKRKKRPDRRCTVNTMEESLALLYREFGMTVTHGTGLWYMDLTRGTFRDPQLVDAVGRMRKWAEVALRHDRSHHSEVVVVSQPQSGFYTGRGGPFVGTVTQQLYVKQMGEFYRAGAPFDWYLAEDLDAVVKGKAKVIAFLDCQYLSDEQYALALKLKEQGCTLVFFHAPARASQTALSWERVKRLTGGETYETLKMKSADELRAIYKAAGVHVYTDSDVVLSANSAWLMLHTREAGDYKIALPCKARKITEITTEKPVAENTDRFTWKLPKHATAVFLLER